MDCSGKSNRIIPHLRFEVVTSSASKLETVYLSLTSLFEFDLLGRYRSSFELLRPGEALGLSAQIAVTPAGFAGVVVVFAPLPSVSGRASIGFVSACYLASPFSHAPIPSLRFSC